MVEAARIGLPEDSGDYLVHFFKRPHTSFLFLLPFFYVGEVARQRIIYEERNHDNVPL
jgi:hypothetical protein